MANFLSKIHLNDDIVVNLKDAAAQQSILNINNAIASLNTAISGITSQVNNLKIINVRDYGATGDGVTDDTSALVDAVADLNTNGGILYFPAGKYVLNQTLSITKVGSVVLGAGLHNTYILMKADNTAIEFGNGSTTTTGFKISDIGLINQASVVSITTYGIFFNNTVNCFINNVLVEEFYVGIKFDHTGNSFITNCGIVTTKQYGVGVMFGNQSVSTSINNVYVGFKGNAADSGFGFYSIDGDIADVNINYIDVANGAYGVFIDGSNSPSSYPPADIRLHEIVVDGSRIAAINIANINSKGNVLIEGGWLNPLRTANNKCINISNANNVNIIGVTLEQLANADVEIYGITTGSCKNINVNGCRFIDMFCAISLYNTDESCIANNIISLANGVTSTSNSINCEECENTVINGNSVYGQYSVGVSYTGTCDNVIVTSNIIKGSTTSKSITATNYVDDNNI